MKEFIEKQYLYLDRLHDFLVFELLSSNKWEKHIDPIFDSDNSDNLVKISNETLYEIACVIDKHFTTYCHYQLNRRFPYQEDRVLHLMEWIVRYCCDSKFEIDDCNDRWGE